MSQTMSKSKSEIRRGGIRWGGVRRGETELAKTWQGVIAEWSRSGLSQAEFCRRHGIKVANFSWWKRRLSTLNKSKISQGSTVRPQKRATSSSNSFVEVRMTDGAQHIGYEVVLSGGRVIRLGHAFDAEAVSRLITAVEAAC